MGSSCFKYLILFCLLVGLQACHESEGPKKAKIESIPGKVIRLDDWLFIAQYRSIDQVIDKELLDTTGAEKKNTLYNHKAGFVHINFHCRHSKYKNRPYLNLISNNYQEYDRWFQYYSSAAKKDFTLKYKGEVFEPFSYQLEANYGLAPFDIISMTFKITDKEPQQPMTLVYRDAALGYGILNFHYSKEDLKI